MMSFWQPYLISALIGLLVGIEREKAHPQKKAMGVRTFLLLSLLGATAGGIEQVWLAAMIAAFCFILIILSYFFLGGRGTNDHGLTTEFAGAIIFTVGFISHQQPILAVLVGPIVALVLFSKRSLHQFTAALKPSELQAAILILLLAVTVLNFLGTEPIDPWKIFVPRKFGMIVLVLALLEFGSYVLIKILGERKGSLIVGFLGGLVSSTAVLLSTSKQSKLPHQNSRGLAATAVAAKLASFLELLLITAFISEELLARLLLPVGASLVTGAIGLFLLNFHSQPTAAGIHLRSPLDLRGVLRLSVLLAAILAVVAVVEDWAGNQATRLISFITGLFELQGISLATATLVVQGHLPLEDARASILLAVAASLIAKIGISWAVTRSPYARRVTIVFLMMGAALVVGSGW